MLDPIIEDLLLPGYNKYIFLSLISVNLVLYWQYSLEKLSCTSQFKQICKHEPDLRK